MMTGFYSWKKIMNKENNCVRDWDYKWFVSTVTTITFYLLFNNLSFHKKIDKVFNSIDEIRPQSISFSI